MSKASELIYVIINKPGYIQQLGMCGPIPNPLQIPRELAKKIIVSGIPVYQFDPETKKTNELTLKNVFGDPTPEKEPVKEEPETKNDQEPKKEEKPSETKPAKPESSPEPISLEGVKTPVDEAPVMVKEDNIHEETPDQDPTPEKEPVKEEPETKNDQEPKKEEKPSETKPAPTNDKKKNAKKSASKKGQN